MDFRQAIFVFLFLILAESFALSDRNDAVEEKGDFADQTFENENDPDDEEKVSAPSKCFVAGRCENSQHVDGSFLIDEIKCLDSCNLNAECNWFSFDYESMFCEEFANCSRLDTTSGLWISGESGCDLPQCWIQGQCLGLAHDQKEVGSEDECLNLCKSDLTCSWFTYFKVPSECVLYANCPEVDETCLECVTGEKGCSVDSKPQPTGKLISN